MKLLPLALSLALVFPAWADLNGTLTISEGNYASLDKGVTAATPARARTTSCFRPAPL